MTPAARPVIEYEPPRGYVSRRRYRSLLLLTLLNFLLLLAFTLGPPLWRYGRNALRARRVAAAAGPAAPAPPPASAPPAPPPSRAPSPVDPELARWMAYTAPADRVVYEEHAADIPGLLRRDKRYRQSPIGTHSDTRRQQWIRDVEQAGWQKPAFFDAGVPYYWGATYDTEHTLFIHRLAGPAGEPRLVWVGIAPDLRLEQVTRPPARSQDVLSYRRALSVQVIKVYPAHEYRRGFAFYDARGEGSDRSDNDAGLPDGHVVAVVEHPDVPARAREDDAARAARWYGIAVPRDENCLRVLAGQTDPADQSHFTIDFVVGDRRGVLEGWLQDDDTVRLRVTPADAWPIRLHHQSKG